MKNTIKKALLASAVTLGAVSIAEVSASADTHTVQSGDTVWAIAQSNNTTVAEIEAINNFADVNMIHVGDLIELPGSEVADTPVASVATPTVADNPVTSVAAPAVEQSTAPVVETPAATDVDNNTMQNSNQEAKFEDTTNVSYGSVYDEFIANGGTPELWQHVVMPESGGNPNAVSPNGYHGLGQTMQYWGYGSVSTQTQGMVDYAVTRYGSVENAIAWRLSHNWW